MPLPLSISPCPILEAIVEIRFDPSIPAEAVFGVMYQSFKADFGDYERLPILQLPDAVLQNDPDLRFKPHYRLVKEGLTLGIGPRVWSLSNTGDYIGWTKFSENLIAAIGKTVEAGFMEKPIRFGLRYINVFDDDIFEKITLSVDHDTKPFTCEQLAIRAQVAAENFTTTLQISNRATFKSAEGERVGSIIDLDTWTESGLQKLLDGPAEFIGVAHQEEKQLFFSLLSDELLKSLSPIYGDAQ